MLKQYAFGAHANKTADGGVLVDYVPENADSWSVGSADTGTVKIMPDDTVTLIEHHGDVPVIDAEFIARCREVASDIT